MSQNFQESSINGASYLRFSEIRISNPLGQVPLVQYYSERVTVLSDGRTIKENLGHTQEVFNPAKVIDILDKATMVKNGSSFLMGDLYPLLFSAAVQAYEEQNSVA